MTTAKNFMKSVQRQLADAANTHDVLIAVNEYVNTQRSTMTFINQGFGDIQEFYNNCQKDYDYIERHKKLILSLANLTQYCKSHQASIVPKGKIRKLFSTNNVYKENHDSELYKIETENIKIIQEFTSVKECKKYINNLLFAIAILCNKIEKRSEEIDKKRTAFIGVIKMFLDFTSVSCEFMKSIKKEVETRVDVVPEIFQKCVASSAFDQTSFKNMFETITDGSSTDESFLNMSTEYKFSEYLNDVEPNEEKEEAEEGGDEEEEEEDDE